jgi:hypothetical protein
LRTEVTLAGMRTPLRWLRINVAEFIALVKSVNETAWILSQRPKEMPPIVEGRPEDFGR